MTKPSRIQPNPFVPRPGELVTSNSVVRREAIQMPLDAASWIIRARALLKECLDATETRSGWIDYEHSEKTWADLARKIRTLLATRK